MKVLVNQSNQITEDLKKFVKNLPSDKLTKKQAEKIMQNNAVCLSVVEYISDYLEIVIDLHNAAEELEKNGQIYTWEELKIKLTIDETHTGKGRNKDIH